MKLKMRALAATAAAAVMMSFGSAATADVIPYGSSGAYNPTAYTFTAAADGDLVAYIVGGFSAGFTNELGLLVNGAPSAAGYGLNNHSSSVGDSFNFGHVSAGDELIFVLHNLTLGMDAYSKASMNIPYDTPGWTGGNNHIYSTGYTATGPVFAGVPAGVYVAFEDLPFPGADFNYDDESFVFTNVRAATGGIPEPATWAMMIGGIGAAGVMIRRRRTAVA